MTETCAHFIYEKQSFRHLFCLVPQFFSSQAGRHVPFRHGDTEFQTKSVSLTPPSISSKVAEEEAVAEVAEEVVAEAEEVAEEQQRLEVYAARNSPQQGDFLDHPLDDDG